MNEFSWLPTSVLKQVPYLPKVRIIEDDSVGGQYWQPSQIHPVGLVEVSSYYIEDIRDYASTLAHEFRHHWQMFNFKANYTRLNWHTLASKFPYNRAVALYFNGNPDEKDALLFEHKLVNTDNANYWIKHILGWKI